MFTVDSIMTASRTGGPQPAGKALHQYACLRCRSRRVKCDKILSGCQNCANHQAQCVYSARRPRKLQKAQGQPPAQRVLLPTLTCPDIAASVGQGARNLDLEPDDASTESEIDEDEILPQEMRDLTFEQHDAAGSARGRLLVGPGGNTRYVNGEKVNQISYIETVLAVAGPPVANETKASLSSESQGWNADATSLLSASSTKQDLRIHYPPPDTMLVLWKYYVDHIDFMFKIIYKPAMEALIVRTSQDFSSVHSSESPLLFAIWLATVTCMTSEECRRVIKAERAPLIRKYRFALEQALAQAGWMTTQNILVLQALAFYAVFSSEKLRSTWILNGIALSIAQAMGLHSDSASFPLGPIETEVRRRVWWMLCLFDVLCAENCGLESHVPLKFDTQLPLNVNDADLESAVKTGLTSRNGLTEMTFTLGKMEMANTGLQFKRSSLPQEEKDKILKDQIQRYKDIYLTNLDKEDELQRLYYYGTRHMINRLTKLIRDTSPPDEEAYDEEAAMLYNADVLEIAHQLPSKFQRHGWFFRCKITQWHAVAYLLVQLCKHTTGAAADRAWEVIDAVFSDWEKLYNQKNSARGEKAAQSLWPPLFRLRNRARDARNQALETSANTDTHTPSTSMTDYGTSHTTPSTLITEHSTNRIAPGEFTPSFELDQQLLDDYNPVGLLGDPFLGSADDLNMEMNWEQLDEWARNFQDGLIQSDEMIETSNRL